MATKSFGESSWGDFLVKEHCGAEGAPLNVLPGRGKEERFKRRIGLIISGDFNNSSSITDCP